MDNAIRQMLKTIILEQGWMFQILFKNNFGGCSFWIGVVSLFKHLHSTTQEGSRVTVLGNEHYQRRNLHKHNEWA